MAVLQSALIESTVSTDHASRAELHRPRPVWGTICHFRPAV